MPTSVFNVSTEVRTRKSVGKTCGKEMSRATNGEVPPNGEMPVIGTASMLGFKHLHTHKSREATPNQKHSSPTWGLKETYQQVPPHHALILHVIGREGPEFGSCRVHSRLHCIQPKKRKRAL